MSARYDGAQGAPWESILAMWASANARHWLEVRGCSMWPVLRDGDRVLVAGGTLKPGAIVAYLRADTAPTALYVHRLLAQCTQCEADAAHWIVTKGDNNSWIDRPAPRRVVLGHVIALQRHNASVWLDGRIQAGLGDCIAWSACSDSVADRRLSTNLIIRTLAARLIELQIFCQALGQRKET